MYHIAFSHTLSKELYCKNKEEARQGTAVPDTSLKRKEARIVAVIDDTAAGFGVERSNPPLKHGSEIHNFKRFELKTPLKRVKCFFKVYE